MYYIYFNKEFNDKHKINFNDIKIKVIDKIVNDDLNIMLCREKFVLQLYHEVINTSSFVLFYKKNKNDKIQSFLSVRIYNNNKWEIALICSMLPGLGSKILKKLIDIVKHQKKKIKLFTTPIFPESKKLFNKFKFNNKNELVINYIK
jgi:hypothetical protein